MKNTAFKRLAAVVMTVAMLVFPLAAQATVGGDRPTKPYDPSAPGFDHVTFNSYTGTPYAGDERNFFTGQSVTGTTQNGWKDPLPVEAGKEYYLRIYIHNGADPSLNMTQGNPGIAQDTRVRVALPDTTANQAEAFISARNAQPGTISDTLGFTAANNLKLTYEPGSAKLYSHGHPGGIGLSDDVVRGGVTVGSEELDGKWFACFNYQGYVYLKVKTSQEVQHPSLTLEKTVSGVNSNDQQESMSVKPGDEAQFTLKYTNTSQVNIEHVVLRDALPAGLNVTGATLSVEQADGSTRTGAVTNINDLFGTDGLDVGGLAAGKSGRLVITFKVGDNATGNDCSANLVNTAYAKANGIPEISDTASVQVSKTCSTPQPLPDTGMEGAAAGALGTTALGAGVQAYIRSKRSLLAALRGNRR